MKSGKRKIINHYNWHYLIPQLSIFIALAFILKQFNVQRYILLSLSLYFLTSGYLKVLIPKSHRKGLFYIRKGEFEGAIYAFRNSYSFFANNIWIDNYRAFTLFSISKLSYREMALMNIIYCYQKLNNEQEAQKVHKELAREFPGNPYAAQ